jgi:hypothetical protein
MALFLMAILARSHHCFNFNISFVDRSSDNLRIQHSGRTDNQNGQFCSPDFPCKVYRLITKPHASVASFPAKGNSKSKGGLGAGSTFRYVVARDARVLTHYIGFFFGTPPPFFSQKTQHRVCFFNLLSKAYVKLHSPRSKNQKIQRNKAS